MQRSCFSSNDAHDGREPRRNFLFQLSAGLVSVALSWMLARDGTGAESRAVSPLAAKAPQRPARAKSIIFLIMEGGPSHVDTFDPKTELEKQDGKVFSRGDVKSNQVKGTRYFVRSPFKFDRYGQCGREVSELFTHLGQC